VENTESTVNVSIERKHETNETRQTLAREGRPEVAAARGGNAREAVEAMGRSAIDHLIAFFKK